MPDRRWNWRSSWWLSFIIFTFVFLATFTFFYLTFNFSLLNYSLLLLTSGLLANLAVIFTQKYRIWHIFGLSIHKKSFEHLLFGTLLPLAFFLPLLGILSIWGISFQRISLEAFFLNIFFIGFAATAEEIIFRGVLFQRLIDKRGEVFAVIANSLTFALLHLFNPNITFLAFINIFLAGVVLSICYVRTSTLWLSIGFHFGWNFWQKLLLGSPISGLDWGFSLFHTKITDLPPILFGGSFGLEGGLVCTVFLIISAYLIAKLFVPVPEVISRILREKYSGTSTL